MSELVTIKSSHSGIELRLNAKLPFPDLLKAVEEKFRQSADFFKNAKMAVSFSGRTLSISEEEQLIQVITQTTNLEIICIIDHDERKELIYKRAVAQCLSEREKSDGQFYRGTLKRRQLLESESSIVILGDVEFGAKVVAKGNIIILGTLYGSVHAGAAGDRNAFIIALSMQPQRLVIGDIEAKRQLIYQDSLSINGPQIAVVDGKRIYLDPTDRINLWEDISMENRRNI